ncbi:GntR family transcriptional regulator [Gordonia sp. C13]|uniref:GntR family transcriptional regulator n=1 Tax=Gordonia sp. C13 TaxID=2935078 RepID=UPI00200B4A90|nr:GntR family transcriptional regulator [Gordonia sp. C13]MCK8614662.1 GntR family transcriptional regulator [Gordonia sp. C13]
MPREVLEPAPGSAAGESNADATGGRGALYQVIRQEILAGNPPPGGALQEVALSNRHGVSRAPVRDALLRLEAEGLVERGPRGAVVRVRTPEEIYDIYQVRIALEAEAVESAIRHATELDFARLTLVHENAVAEADHDRARQLHRRWHRVLAAASRNDTICEVLERLTSQLATYETQSLAETGNLSHSHDEHLQIIDAMRARDVAAARDLITRHLQRTRDVRVKALLHVEDESEAASAD